MIGLQPYQHDGLGGHEREEDDQDGADTECYGRGKNVGEAVDDDKEDSVSVDEDED